MKNFGQLVTMTLGGVIMLFDSVNGCLQAMVTSISHSGSLTDYTTAEDEITVVIGVGTHFMFAYYNDFYEGMSVEIPENKIKFPCFSKEAMYIQVNEDDDEEPESA